MNAIPGRVFASVAHWAGDRGTAGFHPYVAVGPPVRSSGRSSKSPAYSSLGMEPHHEHLDIDL